MNSNKSAPNHGAFDFWVLRLDAEGNKLWERTFGGTEDDLLGAAQQTSDGGFILVGASQSVQSGNKTSPLLGVSDFWIVRLSANGDKLWDRSYGGTSTDSARSVLQTSEGGFLVGGTSESPTNGNKTSAPIGYADYWVVRLDAEGNKLWDRSYGGVPNDYLTDVRATADNGFLLAGFSGSPAGEFKTSTNYGGSDLWLVRIDSSGNKLWDRSYGGTSDELNARLSTCGDGGWVLASSTMSGAGGSKGSPFYSLTNSSHHFYDYWLLRLDAEGNKLWENGFGGSLMDYFTDVRSMPDGSVIVAGHSGSGISGNKTAPLLRFADVWLVRLDGAGRKIWDETYTSSMDVSPTVIEVTPDGGMMIAAQRGDFTQPQTIDLLLMKLSPDALRPPVPAPRIEWQRTFGGTNDDWPYCIVETPDGGCVVAGTSLSEDSGNQHHEGWVLRLDARGNKLWETNLGGTEDDFLLSIQNTADGGFILAGESRSPPSGNKSGTLFGIYDFWVVRLDGNGNKVWDKTFGGTENDEASSIVQTSDGGFLVGGISHSPANGNKTAPPLNPLGDLRADYWVVRVDAEGNKVWDRTYGGFSWDTLRDVRLTRDNGFVLFGSSHSDVGGTKTSTNFSISEDFWLVRTDASGNSIWDKTYGGLYGEQALKLIVTSDGGSLIGGTTQSDIGGNKSSPFHGGAFDYWVVRLDANGNKLWDRDFGGEGWDLFGGMLQTADGGFVISGSSQSPVSGNKTSPLLFWSDMWIVRLDRDGNKVWEQTYNGTHAVGSVMICPAKDGGYFLSAGGQSTADSDFLIVKLSPDPLVTPRLESTVRSGNDLRFRLSGIQGRNYVTEWSSDLQTWSGLVTNRLMSGAVEIVDGGAGGGRRFYRARMVE